MKNPKFSFFLRNKPNTLNQYPIVLTITMGQDRTQVFTGLYVAKNKWNAQTKRVKGHDKETKTINDTLVTIATQARQVSNELLISGMPFNPNTIKEKIKYGFKKNLGTVEAYEIFLERMKRLIPSKYTKATLLKYTNTKERVREFIKHYTRRNDIYLYELDSQFMEDFDLWIRKTYNVNHNTVYKTYQRFTRFLRQEIARGNLDRYPFIDYKIKMEYKAITCFFCFEQFEVSLEVGNSFVRNISEIYDCEVCCNPNKLDYEVYDGEIKINNVGDGNE